MGGAGHNNSPSVESLVRFTACCEEKYNADRTPPVYCNMSMDALARNVIVLYDDFLERSGAC